jgi:hypothetical protein
MARATGDGSEPSVANPSGTSTPGFPAAQGHPVFPASVTKLADDSEHRSTA